MKSTLNVKSCEKCIVAHKPASYRSKKVAEMCIECQMQQYKHFKPESQFKERYFIENKTAELLQKELNHAKNKHGKFDMSIALSVLVEEVGEVAQEMQKLSEMNKKINELITNKDLINPFYLRKRDNIIENLKSELMQVATVCIIWVDKLEKE